MDLIFFKQTANQNNFNVLNLIECHCQWFLSRDKMIDAYDKPVNLENFVFNEENYER